MIIKKRLSLLFLAVLGFLLFWPLVPGHAGSANESRLGPDARDDSGSGAVLDLSGVPVNPFRAGKARLKVFFFVGIECPISNRYAPEVRRYYDEFAARGVDFALVYCDADTTAEMIRKHVKEFSYPCAPLRDPKKELARRAKVRVTPECAVFTASGELVYHGRIDNRQADFGKVRPAPTERELHDAIEAALDGRVPTRSSMPGVGCPIF